jgi:hypothetical protein
MQWRIYIFVMGIVVMIWIVHNASGLTFMQMTKNDFHECIDKFIYY